MQRGQTPFFRVPVGNVDRPWLQSLRRERSNKLRSLEVTRRSSCSSSILSVSHNLVEAETIDVRFHLDPGGKVIGHLERERMPVVDFPWEKLNEFIRQYVLLAMWRGLCLRDFRFARQPSQCLRQYFRLRAAKSEFLEKDRFAAIVGTRRI
jgi:hypothetical protein